MYMKVKLLLLAILLISSVFVFKDQLVHYIFRPRQQTAQNTTLTADKALQKGIEIIAENLEIPWEIAFLPDNTMLVTERSGKLLKVGTPTKAIKEIEGVKHIGEGGLLGIAIDPNFASNNFIYLYSTTQENNQIMNRVERYKLANDTLSDKTTIFSGIKGSKYHDGGKIAFGPDGYLYIATGDAENTALSQDKNSLNGKILRIKSDGSIPDDNPFGNAVYSMGHRNPQGLTWDKNGNLWQTEHGPSGTQTGYDELNIISRGENYGWPIIKGAQTQSGYITPVLQSGSEDTWAPAGVAYANDSLFFGGLRGETLYEVKINDFSKLELKSHFSQQFGRIRAVVLGPDGYLYISTSNTDGRGKPKENDDKIIKINPSALQ